MKTSFPQWKGFEFTPQGCLLEQLVDLSSDLGVAYERSCEYYKDFHTHDRLMLVFPRGACVMKVRTRTGKAPFEIDQSSVLVVPKDLEHDDEGMSSIYDTVALYPSEALIASVAAEEKISGSDLQKFKQKCTKSKRTPWTEQLLQEYFFERVVSGKRQFDGDSFISRRIVREVLRHAIQGKDQSMPNAGAAEALIPKREVTVNALRFIESNLFDELELEAIARHSGASVSTLLRAFKKDVSLTPYAYIKNRRLEEAMRLLKSGAHNVGQVALLVGYDNFGAFTDAFKTKYGSPPSSFTE